jgi:hypothetical protein
VEILGWLHLVVHVGEERGPVAGGTEQFRDRVLLLGDGTPAGRGKGKIALQRSVIGKREGALPGVQGNVGSASGKARSKRIASAAKASKLGVWIQSLP